MFPPICLFVLGGVPPYGLVWGDWYARRETHTEERHRHENAVDVPLVERLSLAKITSLSDKEPFRTAQYAPA